MREGATTSAAQTGQVCSRSDNNLLPAPIKGYQRNTNKP